MIRFAHPYGPSFERSPRFALRPAFAGMTDIGGYDGAR